LLLCLQVIVITISRAKRTNPKVAQTTVTVDDFDTLSDISGPLRGELPHVQIFIKVGVNLLT
jgi:hypothetical protein